jgi:hypothetical protein
VRVKGYTKKVKGKTVVAGYDRKGKRAKKK